VDDVVIAPGRARPARVQSALVAVAAAFAALSALTVSGALAWLDRYAVEHWMPGLDPAAATDTVPAASGLVVPFQLDANWWQALLDVATYPASVLVSFLLFVAVGAVLLRSGSRVAALVLVALWFAANAVEVTLKVALEKPAILVDENGTTYHLAAFDHSFPSGHAMRAVLVAAAIAFVWRRLAWPAAIWALLVPVLLVAGSAHVPSDVVGGLLFGLLAVLATHAALPKVRARFGRS
jgi:membrane-associated phospholipid phosphatase